MLQTLLGLAMVLVGVLLIVFSERLSDLTIALHKWALGMVLWQDFVRPGFILMGIFCLIYGFFISLHVLPK